MAGTAVAAIVHKFLATSNLGATNIAVVVDHGVAAKFVLDIYCIFSIEQN